MLESCPHVHLRDLNAAQIAIVRGHLEEYMLSQHFADEEEAMLDFIEKFRWIMREVYCGFICCDRFDCVIAHEFLPQPPNQNNPVPRDILEEAMEKIMGTHLDKHKWYRQIADTEAAKRDFLNEFGGIIREMISNFGPKNCQVDST